MLEINDYFFTNFERRSFDFHTDYIDSRRTARCLLEFYINTHCITVLNFNLLFAWRIPRSIASLPKYHLRRKYARINANDNTYICICRRTFESRVAIRVDRTRDVNFFSRSTCVFIYIVYTIYTHYRLRLYRYKERRIMLILVKVKL